MKAEIIKILKGIDKDEIDSDDGWWETSTGVEFGAKKLQEILELVDHSAQERYDEAVKSMMPIITNPRNFTKIDNALKIASGLNKSPNP